MLMRLGSIQTIFKEKHMGKKKDKKEKKSEVATPKKAKSFRPTKADLEKARRVVGTYNIYDPRDFTAEKANKLHFLEGKTKAKVTRTGQVIPAKKTYYWVLEDCNGYGIARSYESKPQQIDAIRDAIAALGRTIWSDQCYIVRDDDHNRVVAEGERQGLIE